MFLETNEIKNPIMLRKAAEDIFKIKFKTEMTNESDQHKKKSRVEMLSEDINNLKEDIRGTMDEQERRNLIERFDEMCVKHNQIVDYVSENYGKMVMSLEVNKAMSESQKNKCCELTRRWQIDSVNGCGVNVKTSIFARGTETAAERRLCERLRK